MKSALPTQYDMPSFISAPLQHRIARKRAQFQFQAEREEASNFSVTRMSVRSFAFRTRRRVSAHVPLTAINKSTRRRRRLMERWPEERVVDLKQRQAQSSLERFHEHQAALALLAVRDKEAHERATAEQRERRAAQQRSRRARNKRPTWRQACDLLNQLEAEVAQQLPRTDNGGGKALKYGTIREYITRLPRDVDGAPWCCGLLA